MQPTLPGNRPVAPVHAVDIPVPHGLADLGPDDVLTVEEIPHGPGNFGADFVRCGLG
jgi:hypothetical protein